MKTIIFALALVLSSTAFGAKTKTIKSSTRATASPAMITDVVSKNIEDTRVSTVIEYAGTAVGKSIVFVTIGHLEEGQETFSFEISGPHGQIGIWPTWTEDGKTDGIEVSINTTGGVYDEESTTFGGLTEYKLVVKEDPNTDTLYSSKGTLSVQEYNVTKK